MRRKLLILKVLTEKDITGTVLIPTDTTPADSIYMESLAEATTTSRIFLTRTLATATVAFPEVVSVVTVAGGVEAKHS